jgi:hypothetical protein
MDRFRVKGKPALLEAPDIAGCIVTIDAAG